jgi:hypothetical protein
MVVKDGFLYQANSDISVGTDFVTGTTGASWKNILTANSTISQYTEWTTWNATIKAVTTNPTPAVGTTIRALYKVVGKSLHLQFSFFQPSVGIAGSGLYYIELPAGYTISSLAKIGNSSINFRDGSILGSGKLDSNSAGLILTIIPYSANAVMMCTNANFNTPIKSDYYSLNMSTVMYQWTAEVPIL